MGYRRLDTLTAIAKCGYWLQLSCPCGHVVKTDPLKLALMLADRGAATQLRRLGESMKCGKCGGREFTASHCEGPLVQSRG